LTTPSTSSGKNKSRLWDIVPEESTLIFGDTQISLQHTLGQMEGSFYANSQLNSSSHFNTILACDRRTDRRIDRQTHDDSIYCATIASHGNQCTLTNHCIVLRFYTESMQCIRCGPLLPDAACSVVCVSVCVCVCAGHTRELGENS